MVTSEGRACWEPCLSPSCLSPVHPSLTCLTWDLLVSPDWSSCHWSLWLPTQPLRYLPEHCSLNRKTSRGSPARSSAWYPEFRAAGTSSPAQPGPRLLYRMCQFLEVLCLCTDASFVRPLPTHPELCNSSSFHKTQHNLVSSREPDVCLSVS